MFKVLLLKKLMTSLQLNVKEKVVGPVEFGLYVSLTTVLKRNLGQFVFASINFELLHHAFCYVFRLYFQAKQHSLYNCPVVCFNLLS